MVRLSTAAFLLSLPFALALPSGIEANVTGPESDAIVNVDRRPEAAALSSAAAAASAASSLSSLLSSAIGKYDTPISSIADTIASRTSQLASFATLVPIAALNGTAHGIVDNLLSALPSVTISIVTIPYPTITAHSKNATGWGNSTSTSASLKKTKTSSTEKAEKTMEAKESSSVFGEVTKGCWADNCTNADSGMKYEQVVKVSPNKDKEASGAAKLGVGLVTVVVGVVAMVGML